VRVLGRRLVLVAGLIVGDYLLWNWSLNNNHGALALFSGLTLPPLTIALVWLLVLLAARLLARYPAWHAARAGRTAGARPGVAARGRRTRGAGRPGRFEERAPAGHRTSASSDKIAA
jgi:hypothetical protein